MAMRVTTGVWCAAAMASAAWVGGAAAQTSPIVWEPLYEPGGGGAITGLSVSPHDQEHMISLGDMLGVATSFDGGDTWRSTTAFLTYEFGRAVAFHPTQKDVVWIGSASGPYKSTDRGITWQSKRAGMPEPSGGRYTCMIDAILIDPANHQRLLAFGGTSRNWSESETFGWVWESVDGGEGWKHVGTVSETGFSSNASKGANVHEVVYEPGSKTRLHLRTGGGNWFVSDDAGRTWTRHEPQGLRGGLQHFVFHPKDPKTVWAATGSYTTTPNDNATRQPGGILKSIDGGKVFAASDTGIRKVNAKQHGQLSSNFGNIAVSPANPDVLYTNDGAWNAATIYKSIDGGATWTAVANRAGIGVEHAVGSEGIFQIETATFAGISGTMTVSPADEDRAYLYNSEFIARTEDGGKTFDDATAYRPDPSKKDRWRGRGWNGWCSTNFEWNPYKPEQSVAQAMDAARGWISDDGLKSWQYANTEPHPWMGGVDVGFSRDGYVWITTGQHGSSNGLLRSRDGGRTFDVIAGKERGLPETGWGGNTPYDGIYVHPDEGKRVWVALGGKVIRTEDAGETWSDATEDVGAGAIAEDWTTPGRFYVSAKQGVLVTDDGVTFRNIGGPRPGGRGRINCDALGNVYACQWREGRAGVWRYTKREDKWERLLDEPLAYEVNADPSDPKRLLLVTAQDPFNDLAGGNGVWVSADAGETWAPANEGLAMLRGLAVAFNPADGEEIVVGTYGRGFFEATWPKSYAPRGERRYEAVDEDEVHAEVGGSLVANGSMSEGSEKPSGWEQTWGEATSARDTKVFRRGPASLRVSSTGGSGMGFQQIAGHGGSTLRVSGAARSAGDAKVSVAIQSFDGTWSRNQFDQVQYLQGTSEWTAFDRQVKVPDWAARFNVLLLVDGAGDAWVDDVRVVVVGSPDRGAKGTTAAKPQAAAPAAATAAAAKGGEVTHVIRDFGPSGLDYAYGETWKVGGTVKPAEDGGVKFLRIDATEHGGGGVVLNGMDVAPQGQTHVAIRVRPLEGNGARTLSVNLVQEKAKSVSFNLSEAPVDEWTTLVEPLGGGDFKAVQQVQLQGGNFSAGAQPLKVEIDLIGTTSTDAGANAKAKEAAAADPTSGPPAKDKPSVPGWGFWPNSPQAWRAMANGQVQRSKKGGIDVVFVGDSITQGWGDLEDPGNERNYWEKWYPELTFVNYGIGGDTTRQVLWRIDHGMLDGIAPKVVVLKIGTNNLYGDHNAGSDEEVAEGVAAVVKRIRAKLPQTKVLLLGILPRQNDYFCSRIDNINARIAGLDDGTYVRYLDMTAAFEESHGKVKTPLFDGDQLHLASPGYRVWAGIMRPVFDAIVK